jgi:hypothetical protein
MDGSGSHGAAIGLAEPMGWKARRAAALTLAWFSAWWLVMIPVALMAFCLLGLAHRVQTVLRPEEGVQTNERLPWVGERG